jgi:aspartate/methionine/tyrosine aminotransferase
MKNKIFSDSLSRISEAQSIYLNQLVYELKRKGEDVITLSLGEAFFDIPLFDFNLLDLEKSHHYADSSGTPKLKEKISNHYYKNFKVKSDPKNEILISAGSKAIIYMSIKALINQGDEVILHEPAWLSYADQVKLCGGKVKYISYKENISTLKKHITKKTKMIIINNPNNPAGKIYSLKELNIIFKTIKRSKIWLLVDEAYSDFILNEKFISAGKLLTSKKNLIVVNSLSKNMGISGWRIGYAISNSYFIKQILKLNQHIITCAPSILMIYLEKYFGNILKVTRPQIKSLLKKRDKVKLILNKYNLKYLTGTSTFYFLVNIEKYKGSSTEFALKMLNKHRIAVVPGSAYGKSTKSFIRLGIGTESLERIEQAIVLISKEILQN